MVEPAEHVFNINRRRLLAGTAAATTAAIVPRPNEPGEAAAIQPVPLTPEVPGRGFCGGNARHLLEIARRNEIRRESALPLLSIPKELRRMKKLTDAEE